MHREAAEGIDAQLSDELLNGEIFYSPSGAALESLKAARLDRGRRDGATGAIRGKLRSDAAARARKSFWP